MGAGNDDVLRIRNQRLFFFRLLTPEYVYHARRLPIHNLYDAIGDGLPASSPMRIRGMGSNRQDGV
jgi:hypothetical protein